MFIAKLKVDLPEYNMKAGQYVYCDNAGTNKNGIEYTCVMINKQNMYANIPSNYLMECDDIQVFELLTLINKL